MSMYRQLWFAIILSTLIALVGSLFASTMSSRAYLNEQLRMKNSDNATVLALSLSQKNIEPVELELIVASLFDNGHYASIKVTDPNGKTLIDRRANNEQIDVPSWFRDLFPIQSTPGQAQISSGWKQIGTISLVSHSSGAYATLWQSVKEMAAALTFSGLIACYLGALILRRIKQPLRAVIDQAKGMTERRFIITPESTVPELKQLSSAMNSTVLLLKSMFSEEAERLETLRIQANSDATTGLANRTHFISQLQASVEEENAPSGSLIIIRLSGLAAVNKGLGRNKTDDLLKQVGQLLLIHQKHLNDGLAARLNGTDFALLFRREDAAPIAQKLLNDIQKIFVSATEQFVVSIGFGHFDFGIAPSSLLAQVDAAVASAEAVGVSEVRQSAPLNIEHAPRSAEEWSKLILRAIEQNWVKLAYFPVIKNDGTCVHKESALRLMFGGEWFPAARFLPIAERLGLTEKLDLIAAKLALDELSKSNSSIDIAVNLSAQSIQSVDFRNKLRAILSSKPAAAKHLWLEVPENGVFANIDAFRQFHADLAPTSCHLGLEHFGRQFDKINLLHDLKLNYVKIDSGFVRNIDSNEGNQAFIKGVCTIVHRLALQCFAEGVTTPAELRTLSQLGLDAATGPEVGRQFPLLEK
ncbi:bifunctional diguanylate cyclase/phosphodiesterase [Undibacterium fentianense]|uniref:EAL domain-containing protein n=1 Tax=Undibacterium fentianense TaxID=2828728 RepID=A0A941E281_9BURK|nr:EAL domain-containing protein [Undibacterium fentianense]MBR7799897.1 EAL domain-containing protein [Undibacterium fentianense]